MNSNPKYLYKDMIFTDIERIVWIELAKRNLKSKNLSVYNEIINLRREIDESYSFALSKHWPDGESQEREFFIYDCSANAVDAIFDKIQGVNFAFERDWNKYEKMVLNSLLHEHKDRIRKILREVNQLEGFRLADFSAGNDILELYRWWSWLRSSPEFKNKSGKLNQFRFAGVDELEGALIIKTLIMPNRVPLTVHTNLISNDKGVIGIFNECDGKSLIYHERDEYGSLKKASLIGEGEQIETDQQEIYDRLTYRARRGLIFRGSDVENILRGLICWDIKFEGGKNLCVADALDKGLSLIKELQNFEPVSIGALTKNYHKVTYCVNSFGSSNLPWLNNTL